MFRYKGVAYFGSDGGVSERPLPLAGCASLRAASGRACVGSRRERSAPFEVPPNAGCPAGSRVTKHRRWTRRAGYSSAPAASKAAPSKMASPGNSSTVTTAATTTAAYSADG